MTLVSRRRNQNQIICTMRDPFLMVLVVEDCKALTAILLMPMIIIWSSLCCAWHVPPSLVEMVEMVMIYI